MQPVALDDWNDFDYIGRRLREGIGYYGLGDHSHEETSMTEAEVKPLKPLNGGLVVIVGGMVSNFAEDITNHPRVILWDSQNEKWQGNSLPANTRAVFFTKWVGHASWGNIMREARSRGITVFNNEGTGMLMRRVRELLDISKIHPQVETEETIMPEPVRTHAPNVKGVSKLDPLVPFIDYAHNNVWNADALLQKAKELHIDTTRGSLSVWVGRLRRNLGLTRSERPPVVRKSPAPHLKSTELDASVEILDDTIKSLKDMRQFLIETTNENARLRARLDKFRKMFED